MTAQLGLAAAPLVPWPWLAGVAVALVLVMALYLMARGRAPVSRALALAAVLAALAGPVVVRETRAPVRSVVAVVVDRSESMRLAGRSAGAEAALAAVQQRLAREPDLDVRVGAIRGDTDGTRLGATLDQLLAGTPPDRVAGAIVITDGRIVDGDELSATLPLHQVLVGSRDEQDRRLTLVAAPRTGQVGGTVAVTVKIEDARPGAGSATLIVHGGNGSRQEATVAVGEPVTLNVPVDRRGTIPFAIETPVLADEVSGANNALALSVTGVRDRLRVLLVTGEPYAGLRAWRNLLKADPSVDLVQFTILRSDRNIDFTPPEEMSLIAFPTRELFIEKIQEFDLVIFDRFRQLDVLEDAYLENVARWVEDGGAFLMLAGPGEGAGDGVSATPMARVLPVQPLPGSAADEPFRPALTEAGLTHPVTAPFEGEAASWGRWLRVQPSQARGSVLMAGPDGAPLLVLGQIGQGRAAAVMSDTAWLWQRGHEGGGPFDELFRRTAHWLMKEPDLEEERLKLSTAGRDLVIERQTMGESVPPARITPPTGPERTVTLSQMEPGLWRGTTPADQLGLWRAANGTLNALVNIGPLNPKEFSEVTSTRDVLAPVAAATAGGIWRLSELSGSVPRIVPVTSGDRLMGDDWMGLRTRDVSVVTGIGLFPVFAGLSGLMLLLGLLTLSWVREGR